MRPDQTIASQAGQTYMADQLKAPWSSPGGATLPPGEEGGGKTKEPAGVIDLTRKAHIGGCSTCPHLRQ